MTTFGTIATIGATALIIGIGVGLYIVSKKKKSEECLDFGTFRDKCTLKASQYSNDDVIAAIIVIDKVNESVLPSLYRKYADGRVTKIKLEVNPFPYDLLPDEVKVKFNNGQTVLTKLK